MRQTLLKSGAAVVDFLAQLCDWHTLLGLVLYGGASLLYIVALRCISMSVTLPCTVSSYVAVIAIGHFGFAEPVSVAHLGAVQLISAGVVPLTFA